MPAVANVAINVDSRGAQDKLRQLDSQANKTQQAFQKLGATAAKVAAALGFIQAAKFVFVKTAELERQTKSLEVLTGSLQNAKNIIQDLQQFAAVTPFTSSDLIETAKRLKAFGVQTEDLVDTTKRLGDVAGATGADLSGIATAYGQIQAKGKLQTEELLQLQERGVDIATGLKETYKLTGEEFSKALQKGQISAEAVEFQLKKLTDTGGKYANGAIAQSETLSGKLSTITDNIETLARTIGQVLAPVIRDVFDQAIVALDAVNRLLASGRAGAFNRAIGAIGASITFGATSESLDRAEKFLGQVSSQKNKTGILQNVQALDQLSRAVRRIRPDDPNADRAVKLQKQILRLKQANVEALQQLKPETLPEIKIPQLLAGTSGAGKGKGRKGKTAEEKAFERQLELRKRLSIELKRQNALLRETDKFERSLLQIKFARQDIEAQIAQVTDPMKRSELQALADENSKMEEQNVLRQIMLDQVNSLEIAFDRERTQLEKYMDQLRKQLTDTEAIIIDLSQAIQTSFASAMSSAVQDAVNGTRTVGQVFAQMFADIGNAFIDLATRLLAQQAVLSILGLFGFSGGGTSFSQGVNSRLPLFGNYSGINSFGGFFANGGSVSSGKSYVVGERGPALFVPRSSGTIVPNDKMGGGDVQVGSINIKVENTGDQLSPQAQKQLANQVQGIVLSTLTNERRSGGML